ncbi:hypothetical protein BKA65DRAFT_489066 [Rhexocercosporidium sp. MPI-PUGE-AT-0058]|nr:hypothetical protein BKA65DRAFT_489066 [Rhexocercosporidium sp. MPI-PUGE-AT-0058]
MEGFCRGTRLLARTRLSSKQYDKSIRSFSVSLCNRNHVEQIHRTPRATALPRGSREPAVRLQHRGVSSVPASELSQQLNEAKSDEAWRTMESPDGTPDLNIEYVKIGDTPGAFHPVFLRDACTCPKCVDPSSTQKQFQTTDIPATIRANSVKVQDNGDVTITWENDIPAFGPDHISTFPAKFFEIHHTTTKRLKDRSDCVTPRLWNRQRISEELQFVNFNDYMTDDKHLYRAIFNLNTYGLLLLRNVPESEDSVAQIAGRIGTIRDTFYGRTWDVKSVPKAINVAYTHQFLGLHMDLQYMSNPPGFQLLHCLKNTCEGGDSLFSDSFNAAEWLQERDADTLCTTNLAYHYRNAGEHYYYERPVIEYSGQQVVTSSGRKRAFKFVNYSPPFQATLPINKLGQGFLMPRLARALREFAEAVESPNNLYEYRLKEGECVMFNNRRVLHGRREFEPGNGERWLKGTYIDTDVFNSKWRTLHEQYKGQDIIKEGRKYVHPGALEKAEAYRASKRADKEMYEGLAL